LSTPTSVRLIPLGGLGEIGMNCMALEHDGQIVLLDCGITFPDEPVGVNLIHPDFTWLEQREDDVVGVVLTHGHEDHFGALPFLLRWLDVPVFGPPYALALVRHRLAEHDLDDVELHQTSPGKRFEVGPFTFEPIRVTHSIADSTALAIETPAGLVVHTGDFKIEEDPTDGEHFDRNRFRELGERGVRLLLSDSTNAFASGRTGEERDVQGALLQLVAPSPERVVVALFASNIHRLRSMLEIAEATGRRVLLLGRSMRRHIETATETGYLAARSALFVTPDEARDLPRRKLLVLATGTQGEAAAALARLAAKRHPDLDLDAGDLVILSSRIIPGNERSVFHLINDFARRGIEVRHRGDAPDVHVSGHAHRDEQRMMMDLTRPRAFLPVHGTLIHLQAHAATAREAGIEQTIVAENGAVIELTPDNLEVVGQVPSGRVHIDRAGVEVTDDMLRDRRLLGELGMAVVVVEVDASGRVGTRPRITQRGVLPDDTDVTLLDEAGDYVADAVERVHSRGRSADDLEERASVALRRFFRRELGIKPLCHARVITR
jgi:ribonuclease J